MDTTYSASQITTVDTDHRFLRRVMTVDAVCCAVCGAFLALFAQPVATFVGVGVPLDIVFVGLILLGTSFLLYLTLRAVPLRKSSVQFFIVANVLWSVASIALAATDLLNLTSGGKLAILVQALLVADVAFMEWLGWRRGR